VLGHLPCPIAGTRARGSREEAAVREAHRRGGTVTARCPRGGGCSSRPPPSSGDARGGVVRRGARRPNGHPR
jgi:hypothetical protein